MFVQGGGGGHARTSGCATSRLGKGTSMLCEQVCCDLCTCVSFLQPNRGCRWARRLGVGSMVPWPGRGRRFGCALPAIYLQGVRVCPNTALICRNTSPASWRCQFGKDMLGEYTDGLRWFVGCSLLLRILFARVSSFAAFVGPRPGMHGRRCFAQAFSLVQLADTMQGLRLQTLQCGQSLGRGIPAYTLLVGTEAQKVFVKKLESCQCSHFFKVPGVHEFAPPGIYVRTFVETALAYATPTRPRFGQCPEFFFCFAVILKSIPRTKSKPRTTALLPSGGSGTNARERQRRNSYLVNFSHIAPHLSDFFCGGGGLWGFVGWVSHLLTLCSIPLPIASFSCHRSCDAESFCSLQVGRRFCFKTCLYPVGNSAATCWVLFHRASHGFWMAGGPERISMQYI